MTQYLKTLGPTISNQTFEHKLTSFLLGGVAVLALLYAYGVISTVTLVLERRSIEKESKEVSAQLSIQESTYLRAVGDLTLDKATTLGFKEIKNPQYAALNSNGLSYNVVTHAR